ncbi:MAG TPA: hypothetical protein VIP09_14560 [Dehalococcoidia bacterium]|jgi:hypothetical protein
MSADLSRQVAILAQTPSWKAMTFKQQMAIAHASGVKGTFADLTDAMKEKLKPCQDDIANGLRWDTAAGMRACLAQIDARVRAELATEGATELVKKKKLMTRPLPRVRYDPSNDPGWPSFAEMRGCCTQ